ncbi:hypothetical protein C8R43DRAFT_1108302 [Mycena crocata]|nr:hypothetical protein C8R43DRAFT_1108302 [Mycena crocata]
MPWQGRARLSSATRNRRAEVTTGASICTAALIGAVQPPAGHEAENRLPGPNAAYIFPAIVAAPLHASDDHSSPRAVSLTKISPPKSSPPKAPAPPSLQLEHSCDCGGTEGDDPKYYCGDWRLGPEIFPDIHALSTIVTNYDRFGGLCPGEFLEKYFNATSGFFMYPPLDGFQLSTEQMPIYGNQTLVPGMHVDRFGRKLGNISPPLGTAPLEPQRRHGRGRSAGELPRRRVEKNFTVVAGPIATWFEQPGQGTQYFSAVTIEALVADGYLARIGADDKPGLDRRRGML